MRSSPSPVLAIALVALSIGLASPGRADEATVVPSTLSPRATKEPEPEPVAAPVTPEPGPVVKKPKRPPTTLELVKSRMRPELARQLGRDKDSRMTGMLLVGVGTAALLASTAVWTVLEVNPPPKPVGNSIDPSFGYRIGGIVTLVVGGLFAVPGAIIWGVADRRFQHDSKEVATILDQIKREQAAGKITSETSAPPKVETAPAPAAAPAAVPTEPIPSDRPLYQ